jgi:hypothetical protein
MVPPLEGDAARQAPDITKNKFIAINKRLPFILKVPLGLRLNQLPSQAQGASA